MSFTKMLEYLCKGAIEIDISFIVENISDIIMMNTIETPTAASWDDVKWINDNGINI